MNSKMFAVVQALTKAQMTPSSRSWAVNQALKSEEQYPQPQSQSPQSDQE